MKLPRTTDLALGWLLIVGLPGPCWGIAARFDEPEDSPLFADSRQKAFAQFASQDRVSLAVRGATRQAAPAASEIIVVEGTRWHRAAEGAAPVNAQGGSRMGPVPLGVTGGGPTCATCIPTTGHCGIDPQTCRGPTCSELTCQGCVTYSGPTCEPTCNNWQPTCVAVQCATALFGVTVPQAGQIQMSFSSSFALQYTLQYCTNLTANDWLIATSAHGSGGVMTLTHTNNASLVFYRLLISK